MKRFLATLPQVLTLREDSTSQLHLISVLVLLCVLALSASPVAAQSNPRVRIITPRDNGIVPIGDLTVTIATENFTLDATHHWHLYVDGELRSMVGEGATSWTTRITTSGPHEIKVTLADEQHEELASANAYVTAAPATPRELPFHWPDFGIAMGILALFIIGLILVGLRIKPRAAT